MEDVEVSSLYGIAIVVVILGALAILLAIININISDDDLTIPEECQESCANLEDITSNNTCYVNDMGVCTIYRIVSVTDGDTPIGSFLAGPTQQTYLTACAGTCKGVVSITDKGPTCNSTDCGDNIDSKCSYNLCIQSYKPLPACIDDYERPVGCANNVLYYLQSTVTESSGSCLCSNA